MSPECLGLLVRLGSVLPTARLRGQAVLPEAQPLALAAFPPSRGVVISATTSVRAAMLAVAARLRPWLPEAAPLPRTVRLASEPAVLGRASVLGRALPRAPQPSMMGLWAWRLCWFLVAPTLRASIRGYQSAKRLSLGPRTVRSPIQSSSRHHPLLPSGDSHHEGAESRVTKPRCCAQWPHAANSREMGT